MTPDDWLSGLTLSECTEQCGLTVRFVCKASQARVESGDSEG